MVLNKTTVLWFIAPTIIDCASFGFHAGTAYSRYCPQGWKVSLGRCRVRVLEDWDKFCKPGAAERCGQIFLLGRARHRVGTHQSLLNEKRKKGGMEG